MMSKQKSAPNYPKRPLGAMVWVGFAVSAGFLFFFLRDIKARDLGESLRSISPTWLLLSALVLLSEFWIRALRWKLLLQPIRESPVKALLEATLIGAAGNTLLPMRAGDVARAMVAAGSTGIRLTTVLATNVMERVYDLFGLVSILALTFLLLPEQLAAQPDDQERIQNLALYGKIIGLCAVSGMAVFFFLANKPRKALGLVSFFTRPLPCPLRNKIQDLSGAFIEGLSATQSAKHILLAVVLSLVLWFNLSLAIFLLFKAFHLPLPYAAACFITVAIALAVVVPQAPGYLGVFQSVIEVTLGIWTASALYTPADPAQLVQDQKAFAIVFWAVSFVPVTLLGLLCLRRAGLSLQELWSQTRRSTPSSEGTLQ